MVGRAPRVRRSRDKEVTHGDQEEGHEEGPQVDSEEPLGRGNERGSRKGAPLLCLRSGEGADGEAGHEDAGNAVHERLAPLAPLGAGSAVGHRDWDDDHEKDAVEPVEGVVRSSTAGEEGDTDEALDDE